MRICRRSWTQIEVMGGEGGVCGCDVCDSSSCDQRTSERSSDRGIDVARRRNGTRGVVVCGEMAGKLALLSEHLTADITGVGGPLVVG